MDAGQLGRHGDDVDGPCVEAALRLRFGRHGPPPGQTPRCLRGDSVSSEASASMALRSSLERLAGTATSMVTSSEPVLPLRATPLPATRNTRSEEHTSELQSLMRISYAVFCLKNKKTLIHPLTQYQLTHQ